jgi:hypothetical protein
MPRELCLTWDIRDGCRLAALLEFGSPWPGADIAPEATGHYFCFANGLATSCAQSMTSCAAGLGVRFLSVIMKTGLS